MNSRRLLTASTDMASSNPTKSVLKRPATGAIAGAILGFVIEPLCFWGEPPGDGQIRVPVVGPIIGAATCSTLAALFGGWTFSPNTERITTYVIAGIVTGVLLGASVFPAILTGCDSMGTGEFRSKVFGGYQQLGILGGIPVGALLGFTLALIRNRHRYATEQNGERERVHSQRFVR